MPIFKELPFYLMKTNLLFFDNVILRQKLTEIKANRSSRVVRRRIRLWRRYRQAEILCHSNDYFPIWCELPLENMR